MIAQPVLTVVPTSDWRSGWKMWCPRCGGTTSNCRAGSDHMLVKCDDAGCMFIWQVRA